MDFALPNTIFYLNSGSSNSTSFLTWGSSQELVVNWDDASAMQRLRNFTAPPPNWIFGYISYDLKNSIENLSSKNLDRLQAPLVHFVKTEFVVKIVSDEIQVLAGNETVAREFTQKFLIKSKQTSGLSAGIELVPRISKPEYVTVMNQLKQHIHHGDIYEVNYCQEFFADEKISDPLSVYSKLNSLANAPMSSFVRLNNLYIISASPERFLKREGNRVLSQPIKGTAPRGSNDEEDQRLREGLFNSQKERSENVMITDLVRNDLSRIAKKGSVNVDELMGISSFKTVHQMISTVSCEVDSKTSFADILAATFPMGSMTGAPKIRAMQLIDEFEKTSRGIYSGCIGYIAPEGDLATGHADFDFNVVIRSILYRDDVPYISASVGSAITALSDAEMEYEECLLKLQALQQALL